MSKQPATRLSSNGTTRKERRASGDGATASLRKLKGLLVRPLAVERCDGAVRIVLKERRRAARTAESQPDVIEATPARLCAELSERLLAHEAEHAVRTMRHLVFVHDVLERKGWPGVAAMSGHVLTEALDQLEMLASEDPSPLMDAWLEQIRPLQRAAELRDEHEARLDADFGSGVQVVVSESNFADFETVERDWSSTVPAQLVRSGHHDD